MSSLSSEAAAYPDSEPDEFTDSKDACTCALSRDEDEQGDGDREDEGDGERDRDRGRGTNIVDVLEILEDGLLFVARVDEFEDRRL